MQQPYFFYPALVVRTPAGPFDTGFDRAAIRQRLADPVFVESLYLASPALHAESQKWYHGTRPPDARKEEKLVSSLSRYYGRMSSRCTPFGLFAGCGVAQWGAGSHLVRRAGAARRHTRLDMHYLCALAQHLAALPAVAERLHYFPNSSLYAMGDELRYVELRAGPGPPTHQVSSVAASGYLRQVLAACHAGATRQQLVHELRAEASPEEAGGFIDELIQEQVLVSELEPTVTGPEFLSQLLAVLGRLEARRASPDIAAVCATLRAVGTALATLDAAGSGRAVAEYEALTDLLRRLGVPLEPGKVFQVDMLPEYAAAATLDEALQAPLLAAVEALAYLTPPTTHHRLEQFKALFVARYEDREVPLAEALDTDGGLPYSDYGQSSSSSLVQDLPVAEAPAARSVSQNEVQRFLYDKLREADRQGAYHVALTLADLRAFGPPPLPLPPSLSVMFRLVGPAQVVVDSVSGSSAVNLLARFAHADARIAAIVQDIAAHEQAHNPAVVLAEVCHLPASRTGNILLRPSIRPYEIPYLAQAAVAPDCRVPLADLGLSVRQGQLVVRCRRTNRRIVPRLSAAHNYTAQALPVYQFLCDLQTQGLQASLHFSWDQLAFPARFFPRLTCGPAILQLACWQLEAPDWQALLDLPDEELPAQLGAFRVRWQLPRYFTLADGDNELLVDAHNLLTVRAWLDAIRPRPAIRLREFLYEAAHSAVVDTQGRPCVSQLVAALLRRGSSYGGPAPEPAPAAGLPPVQREFGLGSEWLYLKWYCGPQVANRVLVDVAQPLTEELLAQGLIDQWFFIRYTDPDHHLRLRLHLPATSRIGEIILRVQHQLQPYLAHGYIWKTQTDTYRRELERYGSRTMAASEALFCADSRYLLRLLAHPAARPDDHWLYGLRWLDGLLTAFGCALPEKMALLRQLKEDFAHEAGAGKALKMQLDKKYRLHRAAVAQALAPAGSPLAGLDAAFDYHHLPAVRALVASIERLRQQGPPEVSRAALLRSYLHMLLNRVVAGQPRRHEVLLYDFLYRYYQSQQCYPAAATSGPHS